ncbi:hypothetical protein FGG08_004252 [Glutinoglossum americanum]|uniref:Uncharacterized protein n=1 Tax=Glutinoglossum americanum TaxID=1670608 RepID=A0A9P8IBR2_9PEZI|nr:hypothetical protein FGG08_004252 [Glutinoglossum americanum]
MAFADALSDPIQTPIGTETKCEIIKHLWGGSVRSRQLFTGEINYDPYFHYYAEQSGLALHDGGRHTSVRTHRDIIEIAQHLRNGSTRDEVKRLLRPKLTTSVPNEDELLNGSIDLAASLLLMMEIGSLQYGFSGRTQLAWTEKSLEECVREYYSHPPALGHESVKLEKMFTARNIGRIAGIKIVWTRNLADHLRMINEDTEVAIFHHVTFLENQQSSILPDGLADETLRTLTLLFPQAEVHTRKWFQKLAPSLNLDCRVIKRGQLRADDRQIENFHFWRDRLIILKQVFDEARPRTISQWWCDRRNGVQWYTFWVAILVLALTICFGLVQCVEGALQVYKAFVPSS